MIVFWMFLSVANVLCIALANQSLSMHADDGLIVFTVLFAFLFMSVFLSGYEFGRFLSRRKRRKADNHCLNTSS